MARVARPVAGVPLGTPSGYISALFHRETHVKLSIKGLALTIGIVWAVVLAAVGLANQAVAGYGADFLNLLSIYPGYAPGGLGSVVVLTVWGFVDGVFAGAVIAWLYNRLS